MSNVSPLVIGNDGLPQQLQSGDTLTLNSQVNIGGQLTATSATFALKAASTSSAQTSIGWYQAGQPTDAKTWEAIAGGDGSWSIRTINDAYSSATYAFSILRNGTQPGAMQLMPSVGRVLVGTTTDDGTSKLQVAGVCSVSNTSSTAMYVNSGVAGLSSTNTAGGQFQAVFSTVSSSTTYSAKLGVSAANTFVVQTNGSVNYQFDGSGNFTAPGSLSANGGLLYSYRYAAQAACILASASGTSTAPTAISSSTVVGSLNMRAYNGAGYSDIAAIAGVTDGAVSSTSAPGALTFNTVPSGSVNVSEAMRITSGQRMLMGTTSDDGANRLQVAGGTSLQGNLSVNGVASVGTTVAAQNPGSTFATNAYANFSGIGENYLSFGQYPLGGTGSNYAQWIQSGYSAASPTFYPIVLNPLGGNVGINNPKPAAPLDVTGQIFTSGGVRLAAVSSPSAPAAGYTLEYGQTLAGRTLPASKPSMGTFVVNDPARWRRKVSVMNALGGGTTWFYDTMAAPTVVGTATARTVTAGTMVGMAQRIGYASAATAGSLSGLYAKLGLYTLGTGSLGGFFYSTRFSFSDPAAVSGARAFVGMSSSVAAPTNVEPNTLTNSIGVAQLSTDATQLYLVYGGSAAQTAIALGTGFPPMAATGITGGPLYELTLYSPPTSNGVVYYRLERLDTGAFVEWSVRPGTAGTTLPANTTLLAPRAWRTNNATALAVGLDVVSVYLETEQ